MENKNERKSYQLFIYMNGNVCHTRRNISTATVEKELSEWLLPRDYESGHIEGMELGEVLLYKKQIGNTNRISMEIAVMRTQAFGY